MVRLPPRNPVASRAMIGSQSWSLIQDTVFCSESRKLLDVGKGDFLLVDKVPAPRCTLH